MGKHIVTEAEFVVCPYCQKQAKLLHWKHLKTHNKTLDDVLSEFAGMGTITKVEYEKKCATSKMGAQASKQTHNEIKKIDCIHCETEMEVKKNESIKQSCMECLSKGLDNPDGRTKDHANEAREKTLKETYGDDVTNAAHVPGVKEKKIETSTERYGGIGYSSNYADKCRKTTEDLYGDVNVMKTEEGQQRLKESFRKKYNVDNSMQILEVVSKMKKSLKEYFKDNVHNTKGKTYEEIYGNEKAKELKSIRAKDARTYMLKQIELNNGIPMPNYNLRACEWFKIFDKENNTKGRYAVYGGGEYHIKELGYYPDYINFEEKIIIEWDEPHHYEDNELLAKDIKRQNEIQDYFPDFDFIRIKEEDIDE